MTSYTDAKKPCEFAPGVPDWSTVHRPVGDLFPTIQNKDQWERFKLPSEKVEEFWRNGFIFNVPLLSADQCDKLLDDYKYFVDENEIHPGMDMLYEYHRNQTGDPNNVLMHCLGHWRMTKHFHDLAFLPAAVVPASQLLVQNEEIGVRFWHDQLFAKPAKHGGVVAWHQDYSYWTRTTPMRHLTIHIALEDQTEENGTLKYIPGSHRWTRNGSKPLPVTDFNFKDMESIKTILTEEEKSQFQPVSSLLKKGEASFHHPLAVHGSFGNRSDNPRRAAVLNYFADGVMSDSDDELLKGTPNFKKGEKMGGQFYPLVYDPSWVKI